MFNSFIYNIFDLINRKVMTYVKVMNEKFMDDFIMLERSLIILYFTIIGCLIMYGKLGKDGVKQCITSVIVISFIHAFLFESTNYIDSISWVHSWVLELCSYFISSSGSGSINSLFTGLEDYIGKCWSILWHWGDNTEISFWDSVGPTLKAILAMFLLAIPSVMMFFAYVGQFIISNIKLLILFVFGFIPVFFLSFKETRFIFNSWFKEICCASLTMIFLAMIMGLFSSICVESLTEMKRQLTGTTGVIFGAQFFVTLVLTCLSYMMLKEAPTLAANMCGTSNNSLGGSVDTIIKMSGAGMAMAGVGAINRYGKKQGEQGRITGGAIAGAGAVASAPVKLYSALKGIGNKDKGKEENE